MAEQTATESKHRFTLPSAYTILFALIVVMAIATWIVPAGTYQAGQERQSRSRTPTTRCRHTRRASWWTPSRRRSTASTASRTPRATSTTTTPASCSAPSTWRCSSSSSAGSSGVTMRTGRHPGRDRPPGDQAPRPRAVDDPDPDERLRARRDDVRDGRGEPRVLLARHRRDDRRRVRRHDRCGRRPARLRDRHLRLDDQPVRHRDRVGVRRRVDQRRDPAPSW